MNNLEIIDTAIGEVEDDETLPGLFRAKNKDAVFLCTANHPYLGMEGPEINDSRMDSGLVGKRKVKT